MARSPDHYDHITEDGITRIPVTYRTSVVHACPPGASALTPCCDQTPFQLSRTDRITLDPTLVTCQGARA